MTWGKRARNELFVLGGCLFGLGDGLANAVEHNRVGGDAPLGENVRQQARDRLEHFRVQVVKPDAVNVMQLIKSGQARRCGFQ